jgi:hypothetical protein
MIKKYGSIKSGSLGSAGSSPYVSPLHIVIWGQTAIAPAGYMSVRGLTTAPTSCDNNFSLNATNPWTPEYVIENEIELPTGFGIAQNTTTKLLKFFINFRSRYGTFILTPPQVSAWVGDYIFLDPSNDLILNITATSPVETKAFPTIFGGSM